MLPKQNRLSKNDDFKEVFKKGRYVSGNFISLKVKKTEQDHSRFGFLVGQKIAKKATARNKIKRQLRAAAKEYREETTGAVDIVVMPSAEIGGKSFQDIREELGRIFEKARRR